MQTLWDDEHFAVQSAAVARGVTIFGNDLQPGIVYYPGGVDVKYDLPEPFGAETAPLFSSGELDAVWSTDQLEISNHRGAPQKILNVILKTPAESGQVFSPDVLGLASVALLKGEWDEKFRASVLEDLNAIGEFAQPLWKGQTPSGDVAARAALAKQDLDLKLQWSAGEYARRSIFSAGPSTPRAASSTGLITLTVNTRDPADPKKDVQGCTVWYVERINAANSVYYQSFSNYSSPTSESLAVGYYEIWAAKSGANGPRRTISVRSVSPTQSADVTAP